MVVRKPTYKKWWLDFQGRLLGGHHYLQEVTKFHSPSRSIMIRFQGFRLCLCSRSWLSCFFVQTQQTHEYKKLCFKASNKSNKTPLVTSPLTAILLWKKNKNQIKGLILVPTLAISSALNSSSAWKVWNRGLMDLKEKTFQNDIWNLGPRTIFMAKRGLSRMALYRKRAHLKSLPGFKKKL